MLIVALTLFVASYTSCTSFFKLKKNADKQNLLPWHRRSKSYNKYIIAVPWVGQYGEIFSSRVMYCPSLRSGQYFHPRTEYFPILPAQSCNNICILLSQFVSWWFCHKATMMTGVEYGVTNVKQSSCIKVVSAVMVLVVSQEYAINAISHSPTRLFS